jgi:Fe-S cluster biogenesis protein NfuA
LFSFKAMVLAQAILVLPVVTALTRQAVEDVEFVELGPDQVLKVRLTGACQGCPMSRVTLKEGIEKFVKSELPTIRAVEAVE